jgi:SAM-dependent methyltransferase
MGGCARGPSHSNREPATYIELLKSSDLLRESTLRRAVSALDLPVGSHGLDACCGIGSLTLLLAEAVGPGGRVTGFDISPPFLRHAEERAAKAGLGGRVSFIQGDVRGLSHEAGEFDWLCCADCTAPIAAEPVGVVKELARVVRAGGLLAILAWSSQQLLPGYPGLEARLNATSKGMAPYRAGLEPERHILRALGWLRSAGLSDCRALTFAGTVYGPLGDDLKLALAQLFDMRWGGAQDELSAKDCRDFERLCLMESPDFIAARDDYCAFFTYSMFRGEVGD